MKKRLLHIILLCMALGFSLDAVAQRMPERGLVRKGNRQFARERYDRSADSYRQALEHDSTSFEARYDLASALIRTERYAEAEELLKAVSVDSLRTEAERAEAFYNLGNAQFAQQKLQEALKSYRQSLVLRPDDMEAKYNYALTKKRLEQQQQQQQDQQNQQNNDQNQDQRKDKGKTIGAWFFGQAPFSAISHCVLGMAGGSGGCQKQGGKDQQMGRKNRCDHGQCTAKGHGLHEKGCRKA